MANQPRQRHHPPQVQKVSQKKPLQSDKETIV